MTHLATLSQITESSMIYPAIFIGLIILLLAGLFVLFLKCYKRCPSNRILVIFGMTEKGKSAVCIAGGARFVKPFIQDYAWLSLEPMQIEVPLRGALSLENIRVNVPSVFTVAIGTSDDLMQNAAVRLLGLSFGEIKKQAEDIIFGQMRQVIASMPIVDINRDRDKFLENIQHSLEPELRKIGLILINVNITDITDESGYIEAMGQKAASEAIQKARGDVAENEKMGAVAVANAEREKAVRVSEANRDMNIGTREAERDQQIRLADLAKEQSIGEQQAEFQKEAEIKEAEREMRIRLADANAKAIEGENISQAVIAASKAELMIKQAEAFQAGGTKKAVAEAAVKEAENLALAKAAEAEAVRIEAERRAELEAPAKAEKAKIIVEAEAEAEKRRVEATGRAAEIYAELEARARGEYEILARKGEGLQKIIEACGGAEAAFRLLLLEHFDTLIESSAKAISNIKFDKVVVWDGTGQGGQTATSNWLTGMAKTLPPMLEVMKEVAGVDILPSITGAESKEPAPAAEAPVPTEPPAPAAEKPVTKTAAKK